jgi:hypothetical protein
MLVKAPARAIRFARKAPLLRGFLVFGGRPKQLTGSALRSVSGIFSPIRSRASVSVASSDRRHT